MYSLGKLLMVRIELEFSLAVVFLEADRCFSYLAVAKQSFRLLCSSLDYCKVTETSASRKIMVNENSSSSLISEPAPPLESWKLV